MAEQETAERYERRLNARAVRFGVVLILAALLCGAATLGVEHYSSWLANGSSVGSLTYELLTYFGRLCAFILGFMGIQRLRNGAADPDELDFWDPAHVTKEKRRDERS